MECKDQSLADLLESRLRLPEDQVIPPGSDLSPYYEHWGFTVFRTAYDSPGSDQYWQELVDRIQTQVREKLALRNSKDNADTAAAAHRLLSLFRLDLRSDAAGALNNATMDQVRQLYKDRITTSSGDNDQPAMNATKERLFLLADEEVLLAGDSSWIKCVQVDYAAADYTTRNRRASPQRYFGWMKMTTRSVLELWSNLEVQSLEESLVPRTIGGLHLTTWDGDSAM